MKHLFAMVLTILFSGIATAQPDVIVHLRNGMEVEGQLGAVSDDSVRVTLSTTVYSPKEKVVRNSQAFAVSAIDRVELDRVSVGSAMLTGLGIGAGAGLATSFFLTSGKGGYSGLGAGLFSSEAEVVYHPEQPHDAAALATLGAGTRERGVVDSAGTAGTGGASLMQYLRECAPLLTLTATGGEICDVRFIAVDEHAAHFLPEYAVRWLPSRRDGSVILSMRDIAEVESGDRPSLLLSMLVGVTLGAVLTPSADSKLDQQQMLGMGAGALCGFGVHSLRMTGKPAPIHWKSGDDPAILRQQSLRHLRPDIRWDGLEATAP